MTLIVGEWTMDQNSPSVNIPDDLTLEWNGDCLLLITGDPASPRGQSRIEVGMWGPLGMFGRGPIRWTDALRLHILPALSRLQQPWNGKYERTRG